MKKSDRIIVALDTQDFETVKKWVTALKGVIRFFKIGNELFTSCGERAVDYVLSQGGDIFLDLKFHDIPATVAASARAVGKMGIRMFNVHTLGGLEMMKAAVGALREKDSRPWILGVTVLTSLQENELADELKISLPLEQQVIHLATLAKSAGLDGVVASAREVSRLKEVLGKDFKVVTPGIRPLWAASQDQKRIVTPKDAFSLGSDFIVIGRPITGAGDIKEAACRVIEEITD